MRFLTSRTLRYMGRRAVEVGKGLADAGRRSGERRGGRPWEDFYRRRWQRLKAVRSTCGAKGTGSRPCGVSVKGRISVPEPQKADLPIIYPHFPNDGPSGCPRWVLGLAACLPARDVSRASNADIGHFSARLPERYPSIRDKLLHFWREAKRGAGGDPVAAWEAIPSHPGLCRFLHGLGCGLPGLSCPAGDAASTKRLGSAAPSGPSA